MKTVQLISWAFRIVIAIIFLQTLYFKFTAHPDSVHIFTEMNLEPYGRIGLGIAELITSILILIPKSKILGMFLTFVIISGAIFSHFWVIGIDVKGDGGGLLTLAFIVLASCIGLFIIHKNESINFVKKLLRI